MNASDDALQAVLRRLIGDRGPERIQPVATGWTNRVYRVRCDGRDLYVRMPRPGQRVARADRRREARVWERAVAAGLAPEPVLLDAEAGILVTPAVAGTDLRTALAGAPPSPGLLVEIGRLVGRFHALDPAGLAAPGLLDRIDRDLARAERAGRGPAPSVRAARTRAPELARTHLAHQDLIPENILHGERLWIVDLESAAPGDPDFDLVTLCEALALDRTAEARLFAAAGRAPPDAERRRALGELFQLREHAWAAARLAEGRSEPAVHAQFETSLAALRAAGDRR